MVNSNPLTGPGVTAKPVLATNLDVADFGASDRLNLDIGFFGRGEPKTKRLGAKVQRVEEHRAFGDHLYLVIFRQQWSASFSANGILVLKKRNLLTFHDVVPIVYHSNFRHSGLFGFSSRKCFWCGVTVDI